jgi:hypothetical protein
MPACVYFSLSFFLALSHALSSMNIIKKRNKKKHRT